MSRPLPPARQPKLLFMRHGATALNLAGLRCGGDVDLPLAEAGHRQAEAAARRVAAIAPPVRTIVVAALERTRQTAAIVARRLPGVPIIVAAGFDERRLGEWNRQSLSLTQPWLAAGLTPPGGESNAEFSERIAQAVREVLWPLGPQRVLLVASKGVARVLGEMSAMPRAALDNAEIVEFDLAAWAEAQALECAA